MFRPNRYSFEIDMWALGCVFAEMAINERLFGNREMSEIALLISIFKLTGSPNSGLIGEYISCGTTEEC